MRCEHRTSRMFVVITLALFSWFVPETGFTVDQAEVYFRQGSENFEHNNYKGAIEAWRKGLQLARQAIDKQNIKVFLNNIEVSYNKQGDAKYQKYDYEGAIKIWMEGLQFAKQEDDKGGMEVFLVKINAAYTELGDIFKACSFGEEALKIAVETGDQLAQCSCLLNLGSILRIFDPPKALAYFEQALSITQRNKNKSLTREQKDKYRDIEGRSLAGIGSVLHILGNYPQALLNYEQALNIAKEMGNRREEGADLEGLGNIFVKLGDYTQALSCYQQAAKSEKAANDLRLLGKILYSIANTYTKVPDYPQALDYYQQALAVQKEAGSSTESTECAMGDVFLEQGDLEKAHSIYKAHNDAKRLGRYYLRTKDYRKAKAQFDYEFLPLLEKQGFVDMLLEYYLGLGLSCEGLKDYTAARDFYLKAINFMEKQRERLAEPQRQNFFSVRIGGFRRIEAYEGLVRVSAYLDDNETALYWAENTKARLLLDAMAQRTGGERLGISSELSSQESGLINRIAATQKQMDAAFEKEPGRFRELEKEMEGLRRQRDTLIARLKKDYPEYASIRYPAPLRAKDFKLQPQEALIEYEVTDQKTLGWLVRDGKVAKAVAIAVGKKDLTEIAKKFRGFFEGIRNYNQLSRFDPKVGKALYDLLLKDLADELKPGESVIIVPDAILGIIPFEALVAGLPAHPEIRAGKYGPYPAGLKYFGDEHPVSIYQSATALSMVRTLKKSGQGKAKRMLVLADPDFGKAVAAGPVETRGYYNGLLRTVSGIGTFSPLPSTRHLAEKFKAAYGAGVDVLLGPDATEKRLKSEPLNHYRYQVYATHGILDNEIPYIKEPALVLSQLEVNPANHSQDGFLTMTKVMDLKLDSDLVALTACNTGVGKSLTGEGVMGMGRAFQYAGSKAVLMSLWSVEDESTNLLTEKYFAHLQASKDRLEALRLARLDLRQAGYEHPFFWAAFILVGEK